MTGVAQLGSHTLLLAMAAFSPELAPIELLEAGPSVSTYARFMLANLLVFGQMFLAHAGVANIQISFLEASGLSVTERYDRPYFASNPVDFWRRWNRWIGLWARRYVYLPARDGLAHANSRMLRTLAVPMAFFWTFAVVGALHDVSFVSTQLHVGPQVAMPGLVAFLGFAAATVVWEVFAPRRIARRFGALGQTLTAVVGWFVLMHVIALAMWICYPLLSSGTVPW